MVLYCVCFSLYTAYQLALRSYAGSLRNFDYDTALKRPKEIRVTFYADIYYRIRITNVFGEELVESIRVLSGALTIASRCLFTVRIGGFDSLQLRRSGILHMHHNGIAAHVT